MVKGSIVHYIALSMALAVCLCGQDSGLLDQSCVQRFSLMTSSARAHWECNKRLLIKTSHSFLSVTGVIITQII